MKNVNQDFKKTIKQFKKELCNEFSQTSNTAPLTRKLSVFIDKQLISLFTKNNLQQDNNFCLIALGSYGRRELILHSDIDILLLHTEDTSKTQLLNAQNFIRDCWDIGLEVSHQITTVAACSDLASTDLSVISSIMDAYTICGSGALSQELIFQTQPLQMWPSNDYFAAKKTERKKRYAKYDETAYSLEPNIKYGPGALRDLQLLLAISKRQFHVKNLAECISHGFITEKEYDELISCEHFLWRIRFALHLLAEKPEERLSFDYQIKLAQFFGYQDQPHSLAIEQFMKNYFKVIKRIRELNEMLLQLFEEIITQTDHPKREYLDDEFQLFNNYIEVCNPRVFIKRPQALLKLFLWLVQRPDIDGIRADTLRLVRQSLYLIDDTFKQSPEAIKHFMDLLKQTHHPYTALQKMNRFGVLAHYLDCFAVVTGQMQYDLFHAYTVDQHTMFVIRNIARFTQEQYTKQFPLCTKIMPNINAPEILYLAALFHDVSKGQGGDHSELGAIEAENFAKRHKISSENTQLLVWLVRKHLLMSHTAQRQDIYDPKTIDNFCQVLPHDYYLDYLYLLTVADICATNPSLWNAWKNSLLKELYCSAQHMMQQKQKLIDENGIIALRKQEALVLLINEDKTKVEQLWSQFKGKYFLHESPAVIAKHTEAILHSKQFPLVIILPHHSQGGTEVFIYMPHLDERFAVTTTILSNHHVTIQEANILTCDNHFDLDAYIILDENNQAFIDPQRSTAIQRALSLQLAKKNPLPAIVKKRLPRALAHFKVKTQIKYEEDQHNQYTRLFLVTNDRPGLLAVVSRVFLQLKIHLHNAKVATAGERGEDTFYITNVEGKVLNQEEKEALKNKLIQDLSD